MHWLSMLTNWLLCWPLPMRLEILISTFVLWRILTRRLMMLWLTLTPCPSTFLLLIITYLIYIINNGWTLELRSWVALYFIDPPCIVLGHKKNTKFTENTSEAQALKASCNALYDQHGEVGNNVMYGMTAQVVQLPFKVEATIIMIWAMGSKNKEIHVDVFRGQLWNQIFCVKIRKLVAKHRTSIWSNLTMTPTCNKSIASIICNF